MAGDFENKYLLLRDENTALKKKKNEQEATIKRMYTKLAMIEETMKKKRLVEGKNNQDDAETGGNKAAGIVPVRRDLDTEKFVHALKNENTLLRKKNQSLMEKNRWLEERARQSRGPKRPNVGATPKAGVPRAAPPKKAATRSGADCSSGTFIGDTIEKQTESARKLHRDTFSGDLETALKKRLVIAEKQLVKLQKENEQLRLNGAKSMPRSQRDNNEDSSPSDEEENAKINKEAGMAPSKLELEQAKRDLRDRQAQLAILNARYENLESNALAEREIQEKTLDQMEQMNRQVHKLRTQLQDAKMEKEELEIRISKAGDQEKDIAVLREQNRRLEERMTSLCESPFINDAFQRKERINKLFDLEKLTQQQKATITHMTEEHQKLQANIRDLQSTIKQLKKAKDEVEQDLGKMKQFLMEERNAASLAAIKASSIAPSSTLSLRPEPLQITGPNTPIPLSQPPEKRDACSSPLNSSQPAATDCSPPMTAPSTIVTRRYGDLATPDSFLDASGTADESSVKHLRNRVHVLQIAHLKAMQELERCEKMLHAQTNINRELALEIEELTTQKVSSSSQLQRQMKDLELICEERQQRIHHLEAEVRQLKYAREKLLLKSREATAELSDCSSSDGEESDVVSLSESLILAARDLEPGEQLLELGIVSANFDRDAVGMNSSTFVLCDFYDFESQSTPLLMGSHPAYNLAATFKVTVDGFFLRYLASESVVLEVHQAVRGDFKLIGRASLRLSKLLQSKGVMKESALPVRSTTQTQNGESVVLGTLNIVLRLSSPISEIWRVHLRSYPQDVQLLSSGKKLTSPDDSPEVLYDEAFGDEDRHPVNELQITIFACRNLRSYGPRQDKSLSRVPSSYAHYQLLGFPDVFTNIVPDSTSPEYDLECSRQAFVLEVDACLLRFFSKFRFWVTIFDDQVELDDSTQDDGMIGRCGLLLSELVNGESIRGWFPLMDKNDQHAGDISVLIQWKDPFQVLQLSSTQRARGVNGRLIDLHSLDFDQQHALLTMFSPDMDGRVNYRQFLNYAMPSEELELVSAKIKERFEYAIDSQQISSVQEALYAAGGSKQWKKMDVSVDEVVKAMEKFGIFLTETEMAFLVNAFSPSSEDTHDSQKLKKKHAEASHQEGSMVMIHYMLFHVNPRLSCVERLLCHKIRQTMRGYLQQQKNRRPAEAVPPAQLFARFDQANCGRITRAEFRRCLSALGFELLNVETEYRELVRNHAKPPSPVSASNESPTDSRTTLPEKDYVDLDEEILADTKSKTAQQMKQTLSSSLKTRQKVEEPSYQYRAVEPTTTKPNSFVTPATTEFQRRKQAFMDRMKAIASASSKNLVYEQLEKKKQQQRLEAEARQAATPLSTDFLQQQLNQLHAPQIIHHDAARTLQKQFRQYREQKHTRSEAILQARNKIIEADLQLQKLFKKWTSEELSSLEHELCHTIECEVPDAKRTRLVSRKQFGYFLSQIPRVALAPALLWQIMDYFTVEQRDTAPQVAYQALLNFVCSTVTEEVEQEKHQRQYVLKVLSRLCLDVAHASQVFVSVGDMNSTGVVSPTKFRESLARLGIHLSSKDLHLVMIMFDANGFEILYHALLHTLRQLPQTRDLIQVLGRCRRFGVSALREKLLLYVNSDDGLVSKQDLLRVLMQDDSEFARFEPKDAAVLFQMVAGNRSSIERVPIEELFLRLEKATKHDIHEVAGEWNTYDMLKLQRLAWNCRKLTCGGYPDLLSEFERFDWKETGIVSLPQFLYIARRNGFVVFTELQLKEIAKSFGTKTSGTFGINYRQFLDWTTPYPPSEMDSIEQKLRAFAQSQAENLPNKQLSQIVSNWKKVFASEAKTPSTVYITRAQFVKVCKTKLGLPLDDEELRTVLYTYDRQLEDQIDYAAFLLLNWREAATAAQKVVQFDGRPRSAEDIIRDIQKELRGRKQGAREVAETFSMFGDKKNSLIEGGQFILAMRKIGILLSVDDVRVLYSCFGEGPDKHTLNYTRLFQDELDFPLTDSSNRQSQYKLSAQNEKRLESALDAAVKYSLPDFEKSLVQFQEFCIVHRFAEIAPTKLWRQMESNGLVDLLSKRGVGLLTQKFSMSCPDYEGSDGEADVTVSLKAVHGYLKDGLKQAPPCTAVSPKKQEVQNDDSVSAALQPGRTPLDIVRQLLDRCDEQGLDFRGEFEVYDRVYSGFVTGMEFKQVLLGLGMTKVAAPSSPEAVIGQLVRQFRNTEDKDAVNYTTMLHEVTQLEPNSAQSRWCNQMCEHLRSRIRAKANIIGKIDFSDFNNYRKLDVCFNHFDREHKGFLTAESLHSGLSALEYNLSADQLELLLSRVAVFRHSGGGLSRTEFDSFVLDPYGFRLLNKLSQKLYSDVCAPNQKAIPRVAMLSRLFMENDSQSHQGSLPAEMFWSQLEQALETHLTLREKLSLQHLFDVKREGKFAYKLFLKVISQWRATATLANQSSSPVKNNSVAQVKPMPLARDLERVEMEKPPCSRDAVLRSLHNQLSSIDFDSQVEIVEEYFRRKDWRRTGSIKMKNLKRIFNQIGLSLSADAFTSLQMFFAGSQEEPLSYEKLLAELKALHEESNTTTE